MKRTDRLPELLAPAGSEESLRAALAAGADAVYFGGAAFSNRMRAKNFTADALPDAIRLCHDCGAKAFITLNTRVRDRELDDALRVADAVLGGSESCDAVIAADFGLAAAIQERYPHAVLHASTQTSLASPADCRAIQQMGFSRLVLPRELTKDEITAITADAPIETELFLHGAHCVSCSGQCLLSYVMGGRSGNRGECAQPCRLPFSVNGGRSDTPLSLADLCLAGRLTEVIGTGVCSLKIEGRLKSPAYVYGVTAIYRRLLDEGRDATPAEIRALGELFTRGFTDGYFTRKYSSMHAAPSAEGKSADVSAPVSAGLKKRKEAERQRRLNVEKIPISGELILHKNTPATLTFRHGNVSVTVTGEVPTPAEGSPLGRDSAVKSLAKLGGTPFSLAPEDFTFTSDENLWMPAAHLNALRRDAVDGLIRAMESTPITDRSLPPAPAFESRELRTCEIWDPAILTDNPAAGEALIEQFDIAYLPMDAVLGGNPAVGVFLREKHSLGVFLPVYTPSDDALRKRLGQLTEAGIAHVLTHTPGQLHLATEAGLDAAVSWRCNVTNAPALDTWRRLGAGDVILSPELPAGAVRSLRGGGIVYGHLPLMTLARCVICGGKCEKGNFGGRISDKSPKPHRCRADLTDRRGEIFPVLGCGDCTNILVNPHPIWMADRESDLRGIRHRHFLFTIETAEEALAVLRDYETGAKREGNIRRL